MNKRDHFYLICFYVYTVFIVLKYRGIERAGDLANLLTYSFQDFLFFTLFSVIVFLFFYKQRILLVFILAAQSINILFISKTSYPISQSLLSQLGDFATLQTSVTARTFNFSFLALAITLLILAALLYLPLFYKPNAITLRIAKVCCISLFATSSASCVFNSKLKNNNAKYSIFYSIFQKTELTESLISEFKKVHLVRTPSEWKKQQYSDSTPPKPYNIVVLVIETLSFLALENDHERVMPRLTRLMHESIAFNEHYANWPFSSKSLYALTCGKYPHLSSTIEMRVLPKTDCDGWVKTAQAKFNYDSYLGYTGYLNYDNMGSFFKTQAFKTVRGRSDYETSKSYQTSLLSIDDMAMVDDFDLWLENKESFISFLITMNSHFPFWSPGSAEKPFENAYKDALHYQDKIIGETIDNLKKRNLWDKTIFVVTGDHGLRVNETTADSQHMHFKVPLVIHHPGKKPTAIEHPTAHSSLGSSLLKMATGIESGYIDQNLFSQKPIYMYSEFGHLQVIRLSKNSIAFLDTYDFSIKVKESWKDHYKECSPNCTGLAQEFYEFISHNKSIHSL